MKALLALVLVFGCFPQPALADLAVFCEKATPLSLNAVHHVYSDSADGRDFFRLDVPEAGLLSLEVADPAPGSVRPRIDRIARTTGCAALEPIRTPAPDAAASWYVLGVAAPGTYFLRVASGAEQVFEPGFYSFRVVFAASGAPPAEGPAAKAIDEWESDPISVLAPGVPCRSHDELDKAIDEWESDPISVLAPGVPCEKRKGLDKAIDEWESDPISLVDSGPGLQPLCGGEEGDEPGDSIACALEIDPGAGMPAEIGPGDLDVRWFELTTRETVVLESSGEIDTYAQLLDGRGLRLAADDDSGPGANFRIVATLGPGRYYLRVESLGPFGGPYRLELIPRVGD